MKNEQEIQKRLNSYKKMLDYEENQSETMQIKLWQSINELTWVLSEKEK